MIKISHVKLATVLFGAFLIVMSCTRDQLPPPEPCAEEVSYAMQIDPIMKTYCAYTGCHVSNFAFGAFIDYGGVTSRLDNILFTIDNGTMPDPSGSGPDSLSQEDLELLNCWVQQGAPDN